MPSVVHSVVFNNIYNWRTVEKMFMMWVSKKSYFATVSINICDHMYIVLESNLRSNDTLDIALYVPNYKYKSLLLKIDHREVSIDELDRHSIYFTWWKIFFLEFSRSWNILAAYHLTNMYIQVIRHFTCF